MHTEFWVTGGVPIFSWPRVWIAPHSLSDKFFEAPLDLKIAFFLVVSPHRALEIRCQLLKRPPSFLLCNRDLCNNITKTPRSVAYRNLEIVSKTLGNHLRKKVFIFIFIFYLPRGRG